jgi:uncharacterized cupin superfamily protein
MTDLTIHCEHKPAPMKLEVMGVYDWPVWKKEESFFPWVYDSEETCYIIKGKFRVTTKYGDIYEFERGDLITFPKGLSCHWEIFKPVEKHYRFK